MQSNSYDELLARAKAELHHDELARLGEELVRHAARRNGARTISELEGLGEHLWRSINADDYVRQERDSWSG